jgi:hypothetical protein
LVGTTPLPLYVQISKTDVPLTTGPVSVCPSAAFTTAALGHDRRCVEPDGALVTEATFVGLFVGLAFGVEDPVVRDAALPLDPHAANNNMEQATTATVTPPEKRRTCGCRVFVRVG